MLRRAAHAGFTADEVAAATFAAATERKRPGPLVRVLFAECTSADAGYDAERLVDAFPGLIEVEGALIDDMPERLDRFHYDLVATTTFHADEAQVLAAGRVPVVAMLVGPGYLELVHEIAGLKPGSRVGLVCPSERGADNMLDVLRLSGATGIEIVTALTTEPDALEQVDATADLILHVARSAGRRPRSWPEPAGTRPLVDLRVRPVRAGAARAGRSSTPPRNDRPRRSGPDRSGPDARAKARAILRANARVPHSPDGARAPRDR